MLLLALVSTLFVASAVAGPNEDFISSLPGLNYTIDFFQYSGYLNGTPGRHLHYWFVESQNNPVLDPVLLWLNGGPGCSSLMGFLTELGPFRVADDGVTLVDNPYAWNKIASVLFLESPACVGFAYDDNNNCATGDDEVADMNYLAIQDFFDKFPEFKANDFYITGESYAGIYIPTLLDRVVKGQGTYFINLAGYAIGNGLLSYDNNDNSLMFYGYYHALFDQTLWNDLISSCCTNGVESKDTCDFSVDLSAQCDIAVVQANYIVYYSGLNHYNLYGQCDSTSARKGSRSEYETFMDNIFRAAKKSKRMTPEPYSDPPCLNNDKERNYLNQASVRDAIHIPSGVQSWDVCSDEVSSTYTRDYDRTTPQIQFQVDNQIRGLIFNGDTDMSVNFLGNDWDIATLNLTNQSIRKKWTSDNDVAGYYIQWDYLDFVTVRGSGHMVPEYRPIQALQMITAFVNNQPY